MISALTNYYQLTPPHPSWLNKASLIEFNCSILADEVLLVAEPLFPLPEDTPLEFAVGIDGLLPPLLPFVVLFVPRNHQDIENKELYFFYKNSLLIYKIQYFFVPNYYYSKIQANEEFLNLYIIDEYEMTTIDFSINFLTMLQYSLLTITLRCTIIVSLCIRHIWWRCLPTLRCPTSWWDLVAITLVTVHCSTKNITYLAINAYYHKVLYKSCLAQ